MNYYQYITVYEGYDFRDKNGNKLTNFPEFLELLKEHCESEKKNARPVRYSDSMSPAFKPNSFTHNPFSRNFR